MGSAQYPRIYFNGYQYWNPNTVNNNDYGDPTEPYGINTWDVPHAKFDREYLESKGVERPEEIPPFLETNIPYEPPTRLIPPAEWGLYGGQQCGFVTDTEPSVGPGFSVPDQKTLTTGYTDASGAYGDSSTGEPWVGQPLQLKSGKLVDVNPMSFWSSQVFTNKISLGTDTGFDAKPAARMHSRFISTAKRNYNSLSDLVIAATYGATFQTCCPKDTVVFNGTGGPLEQQFTDAFNAGAAGVMLRYSAYATLYFQGSVFNGMDPGDRYPMLKRMGELYQAYTQDPDLPKPISQAYSRVVGWIGLWQPGELVSVPGGRFLIPYDQGSATGKNAIEVIPRGLTAAQYQPPPSNLPPNTDVPISAPQSLGPATVEVVTDINGDAERFTLDLNNTFPERDSTGLKADFGTVKFGLQPSSGSIVWISENVPYDQTTYEQYGGLVDLTGGGITAAQLLDGSFVLQVESGQNAGSTTDTLALIETLATSQNDPRGLYAEQPDPSFTDGDAADPGPGMPSTAPTCELQVRYRGYAPADYPADPKPQMKLSWQAYSYTLDSYPEGEIPIDVNYKNSQGVFVPFTGAIDVPADGSVEVQVVSKGSAIPNLVFLPWAESQGEFSGAPFMPPTGIGSSYYNVIKCINWDNDLAEAFDQWLNSNPPVEVVTAVVWKMVFEVYHYGFPVMNQFIDSPASFQQQASSIQQVTDPETFDKGGYMPVTRTWSAGQRHIMNSYVAYLNSHGAGDSADDAATRFKAPKRRGLIEKKGAGPAGVNLGHG